jgi:hypothetical protein
MGANETVKPLPAAAVDATARLAHHKINFPLSQTLGERVRVRGDKK